MSGNARSEQLLVMPTESLTNWEWLPARRSTEWIGMFEGPARNIRLVIPCTHVSRGTALPSCLSVCLSVCWHWEMLQAG